MRKQTSGERGARAFRKKERSAAVRRPGALRVRFPRRTLRPMVIHAVLALASMPPRAGASPGRGRGNGGETVSGPRSREGFVGARAELSSSHSRVAGRGTHPCGARPRRASVACTVPATSRRARADRALRGQTGVSTRAGLVRVLFAERVQKPRAFFRCAEFCQWCTEKHLLPRPSRSALHCSNAPRGARAAVDAPARP